MDKDPVFLALLKFQPVLSIARAMMGPLVRLRGLSRAHQLPGRHAARGALAPASAGNIAAVAALVFAAALH